MNSLKNWIRIALLLVVFLMLNTGTKAQVVDSVEAVVDRLGHYLLYRNHDTTYISNYGSKLGLRLLVMNKYNYFTIWDTDRSKRIQYRPARDLYLGVGFAYKYIAVDLTAGVGLYKEQGFEEQRTFDFQGRVFSSKHYFAATVQYFRGYKLNSINGVDEDVIEANTRREDLRTTNIELQYLYAFNYTKYSIKAPFVLNERQKRSAGSLVAGAAFSTFNMGADSSVIPVEVQPEFSPNANMSNYGVLSLGVNFGYMYTLVMPKNLFLTVSLIPGAHLYMGDYSAPNIQNIDPQINFRWITMNSLGYNGKRFFTGINANYSGMLIKSDSQLLSEIAYGKVSFFAGYRFGQD